MKARITQQVDSDIPGKPHMPGTIMDNPKCWWLCTIYKDGLPVAEPADEECETAVAPHRERLRELRETLEAHAGLVREMQQEAEQAEETQRLSEFENLLRENL